MDVSRLEGKTVLVTGAASGIGRETALLCARRGADLVICDLNAEGLAATESDARLLGRNVLARQVDVADREQMSAFADAVHEQTGAVDLLVNNAGVASPPGMDWEVDPSTWWRTLEVNLHGPFLCARAVLPGMITRRRGRIITISSSAAFGNHPALSAYGASKSALTHWSGRLAAQLEQYGVAVIVFAPGVVRTAMTEPRATSPDWLRLTDGGFQRLFAEGRDDSLERTVEAFMVLASGRADALTGRHLSANDDLTELIAGAQEIRRDNLYVGQRGTMSGR